MIMNEGFPGDNKNIKGVWRRGFRKSLRNSVICSVIPQGRVFEGIDVWLSRARIFSHSTCYLFGVVAVLFGTY